jgi:hypothetical protein
MARPLPSSVDTVIVGRCSEQRISSQVEIPEVNGAQEMARQR